MLEEKKEGERERERESNAEIRDDYPQSSLDQHIASEDRQGPISSTSR